MKISVLLSRPSTALVGAEFAAHALRGIARANQELIQRKVVPPLYQSGARYIREAPGVETFSDAYYAHRAGGGDCSTLAAWRVGELWAAGESGADIRVHWRGYRDGHRLYHITVRRADGSVEDPSRLLGM